MPAVSKSIVVGLCLAVSLVSGLPAAARAATGSSEPISAEEHLQRAADELSRDEPDHARAARDYVDAYAAMPAEARVGEFGQYAVAEAIRLHYEQLWPATNDPVHLERCESIAREYLGELEAARAAGRPTSEPNAAEAYIRDTLAAALAERSATAASATPAGGAGGVPPEPEPTPPVERAPADARPRDGERDTLALALVSAGTVVTVAGAALTIDALLFPSMIEKAKARQRALDEAQGDLAPGAPDPPAYVEHEQRMLRRRNVILASGLGTLVVGIGLMTWGNVRYARKRSSTTRAALRLTPRFGRTELGMNVSLRF